MSKNKVFVEAVSKLGEKFICVLGETIGSDKKIPVSLKDSDAYYINPLIEKRLTIKQTGYEFFTEVLSRNNLDIEQLNIDSYHMGLFECSITITNQLSNTGNNNYICSISDIIIFSLINRIPIYIDSVIFETLAYRTNYTGVMTDEMNEHNSKVEELRKSFDSLNADELAKKLANGTISTGTVTIDTLKAEMEKAVYEEDYVKASQLKSQIEELTEKENEVVESEKDEPKPEPKKRGRKKKPENNEDKDSENKN